MNRDSILAKRGELFNEDEEAKKMIEKVENDIASRTFWMTDSTPIVNENPVTARNAMLQSTVLATIIENPDFHVARLKPTNALGQHLGCEWEKIVVCLASDQEIALRAAQAELNAWYMRWRDD